MAYHILYYQDKLVGVTPFDWVSLPDVSIKTVEGDVPDLNKVYWDSDELELIPIQQSRLTKLDFLSRFTVEERIAIRNSNDDVVKDFMELLNYSEYVDLTDARTISAINYFHQIELISQDRIRELLT